VTTPITRWASWWTRRVHSPLQRLPRRRTSRRRARRFHTNRHQVASSSINDRQVIPSRGSTTDLRRDDLC